MAEPVARSSECDIVEVSLSFSLSSFTRARVEHYLTANQLFPAGFCWSLNLTAEGSNWVGDPRSEVQNLFIFYRLALSVSYPKKKLMGNFKVRFLRAALY